MADSQRKPKKKAKKTLFETGSIAIKAVFEAMGVMGKQARDEREAKNYLAELQKRVHPGWRTYGLFLTFLGGTVFASKYYNPEVIDYLFGTRDQQAEVQGVSKKNVDALVDKAVAVEMARSQAEVKKVKAEQKESAEKAVNAAVEKALEERANEVPVLANPNGMNLWARGVFENEEVWQVGPVSSVEYLALKTRNHQVAKPKDYASFVLYEGDIDGKLVEVMGKVSGKTRTREELIQSVFDYIGFQLLKTESMTSAVEGVENPCLRYPLETVMDNGGTEADLAIMAAAMLKSAGQEVILLYYPQHGEKPARIIPGVVADFKGVHEGFPRVSYPMGGKKLYPLVPPALDDDLRVVGQVPEDLMNRPLFAFPVK